MEETCLFCGQKVLVETIHNGPSKNNPICHKFNCQTCGLHILSNAVHAKKKSGQLLGTPQELVNCGSKSLEVKKEYPKKISYWVLDENSPQVEELKNHPEVVVCVFEEIKHSTVEHANKPYVLLEQISKRASKDGAYKYSPVLKEDVCFSKIPDLEELKTLITFLVEKGLVQQKGTFSDEDLARKDISPHNVRLTVEGWDFIWRKNSFPNTNKVFIGIQFNWEDESLREEVLKSIKNACKKNNYDADIVTQDHTGNVTDQIISEIKKSRFMVAELTYNNKGVYFESGFARGLGMPVFHLIRDTHIDGNDNEGKKIHFDIQQVMYRKWNDPQELETELDSWIFGTIGPFEKS